MKQLKIYTTLLTLLVYSLNGGDILIKLKNPDDVSNIDNITNPISIKNLGGGIYLLKLPNNVNITKESKRLSSHPSIIYAHPDRIKTFRKR